jgi:putative ABC transport system permease protein
LVGDFGAFDEGTVNLSDGNGSAERFDGVFVSAGLLSVPRTPPSLGRLVQAADVVPGAPKVVLLGHAVWKNRYEADPTIVGRQVRVNGQLSTIIGVMPEGCEFQTAGALWVPLSLSTDSETRTTTTGVRFASVAVRASGAPMALASDVRREIGAVDADLPIYWVRTMEEYIAQDNWHYQVFGTLVTAFGAAALFLATIGLYGVMALSVTTRVQEIGVRLALGASGGQVMRMIVALRA